MAGSICKTAAGYLAEMNKIIAKVDARAIDQFSDILFDAWKNDQKVYVFGNGGSASTASHYVLDLVKTASVDGQKRLKSFCVNDNVGLTTAVGNDISYEESFSFPLSAYAEPGDVAVAISVSGNSPNVLRACEWARDNGMVVVAMTGFTGGKVRELASLHVNIPSDNYGIVEDLHLSVGHMVAQAMRARVLAACSEEASCRS
jgi:D-sedoheptulose 7-phosphate isomerase